MVTYSICYEFSNGTIYFNLNFQQVKKYFNWLIKQYMENDFKYEMDFRFFRITIKNGNGKENEVYFLPGHIKWVYHLIKCNETLKIDYVIEDFDGLKDVKDKRTQNAIFNMFYKACHDIQQQRDILRKYNKPF